MNSRAILSRLTLLRRSYYHHYYYYYYYNLIILFFLSLSLSLCSPFFGSWGVGGGGGGGGKGFQRLSHGQMQLIGRNEGKHFKGHGPFNLFIIKKSTAHTHKKKRSYLIEIRFPILKIIAILIIKKDLFLFHLVSLLLLFWAEVLIEFGNGSADWFILKCRSFNSFKLNSFNLNERPLPSD